jgi:hypothetical protein
VIVWIKYIAAKTFKFLFTDINSKIESLCDLYKDLQQDYFSFRLREAENREIIGKIKILEEQQEIMHNFLVEINKYLSQKSQGESHGNGVNGQEGRSQENASSSQRDAQTSHERNEAP